MPLYIPNNLVQTAATSLGSNITTTSGTFATFLTLSVTTFGGILIINSNITHSNSTSPAVDSFRIQVNGSTVATGSGSQDGGSLSGTSAPLCTVMGARVTGLAAGAQTITLQWAVGGGTARINASTGTNGESAYIEAYEVYV